jgi:hypothetical protein
MDSTHFEDTYWLGRLKDSGQKFVLAGAAGDFSMFLYRPGSEDAQGAHARAEVYFVVAGCGAFESGLTEATFAPGDALFVPAGEAHRFLGGDDVMVWASFFGAPIDGVWNSNPIDDGSTTLALALASQPAPAGVWSVRWSGGAGEASGLGLVIGQHMVCARLPAAVAGGVVAYRKGNDGSLRAIWAHTNVAQARPGGGHAESVESPSERFEGRYRIQYTNSDGSSFGPLWELEIDARQDIHELSWQAGETYLRGIGMVRDGRLYAVWGQAADREILGMSLLELPVAGQAAQILELLPDWSTGDATSRTWMRNRP